MARRGSVKDLSIKHESFIARLFGGHRSRSSGAAIHEDGDVRTGKLLIECKLTGSSAKPAKSISIRLDDLTKITNEAYEAGRTPAMALRIIYPGHPLADIHGNIDLVAYPADYAAVLNRNLPIMRPRPISPWTHDGD